MTALRLAVDLSGPMIRILVGAPGGPMRSAEAPAPPGSMKGGAIEDSGAVANVLRQLVSGTEVKETRAMIAASDSLASFRVLTFAGDATEPQIDSFIRTQLPSDGIRMGVQRQELTLDGGDRTVYAVAFDRPKVQGLAATARLAGLEPVVVELKSLCVARAVSEPACVVVDLEADPAEIFLIDRSLPRLWHSFKIDLGAVDEVAGELASALRSVLSFYRRLPGGSDFGPELPVLISTEHSLPSSSAAEVASLVGRPILALPPMPRISSEIRHGTFLACIGLILRRR